MSNLNIKSYINQNLITWVCGMFALFVSAQYDIDGCFKCSGQIISGVATISLLICLVAYTRDYWYRKNGTAEQKS